MAAVSSPALKTEAMGALPSYEAGSAADKSHPEAPGPGPGAAGKVEVRQE
eukprot:CAMPEP_0172722442 /NCGR_PEP_ID=MMETSP1074-20121228/81475_1 /TAXON_ID=2916 /ORGANISM="Ceratium fusus, Strain PA161109" /LENGTH=49 /DNA_ID=CAMNT_0013548453 /DNA_START=32 /DNA_END=182 /DNA_ORIENTATION=-